MGPIRYLHIQGKGIREIAKELGTAHKTVRRALRRGGRRSPGPEGVRQRAARDAGPWRRQRQSGLPECRPSRRFGPQRRAWRSHGQELVWSRPSRPLGNRAPSKWCRPTSRVLRSEITGILSQLVRGACSSDTACHSARLKREARREARWRHAGPHIIALACQGVKTAPHTGQIRSSRAAARALFRRSFPRAP
jgi:Helix-turn-helix domain